MDPHRILIAARQGAIPSSTTLFPWSLHLSHKSFVNAKGECVTYLGVSAFPALDRWMRGEDLGWLRRCFPLANILRVWPYVAWNVGGWDAPPPQKAVEFAREMQAKWGWGVEFTVLTDDNSARIPWAKNYIDVLARAALPNILLEGGNEPLTNKRIDIEAIRQHLDESGYLWATGYYEEEAQTRNLPPGSYGTAHTGRTLDFARRAHDLWEYKTGDGPDVPHDRWVAPWVGDEPIRPDQVVVPPPTSDEGKVYGTVQTNFRAYGAVCSLLGGGVTFHYEGGKTGQPPNVFEQSCADEMFRGATAFNPAERLGAYDRIVEPGQIKPARTYTMSNSMVRIWQAGNPPAGWRAIDNEGILCVRG